MKNIFKVDLGNVANDGKKEDIIVNSLCRDNLRTGLIGGGIIAAGIAFILISAFKNGAYEAMLQEFNAQDRLGLIKTISETGDVEWYDHNRTDYF